MSDRWMIGKVRLFNVLFSFVKINERLRGRVELSRLQRLRDFIRKVSLKLCRTSSQSPEATLNRAK